MSNTPWNLKLAYRDSRGDLHMAKSEAELAALCAADVAVGFGGPTVEQRRAIGRICALHVDNAKRSAVAGGGAPEPTDELASHWATVQVTHDELGLHLGLCRR